MGRDFFSEKASSNIKIDLTITAHICYNIKIGGLYMFMRRLHMWLSDKWQDFEIIDCSDGEKLERWGGYTLVRPDPQAIWSTERRDPAWFRPNARYARSSSGGGRWVRANVPEAWQIHYGELTFNIKLMNFKHTGIFPEQACNWDYIMERVRSAGRKISVLNLFAYTGAASLAAAAAGAEVCHVDAAKGMVSWARENAAASGLADRPIRWIVEDCRKFVEREIRRGRRYDAIIMDPPSYGRGPSGKRYARGRRNAHGGRRQLPAFAHGGEISVPLFGSRLRRGGYFEDRDIFKQRFSACNRGVSRYPTAGGV